MSVDDLIRELKRIKRDFPDGGRFFVTNGDHFTFEDICVDRDENEELIVVLDT